jgi:hypothetical protein
MAYTVKPKEVTRRVLEPMRQIQMLVFARKASGPFSCYTFGRRKERIQIVVLGVHMPLRSDPAGVPVLRTLTQQQYHAILDRNGVA